MHLLRCLIVLGIIISTGQVQAQMDADVKAAIQKLSKDAQTHPQSRKWRLWCDEIVHIKYPFPSPASEHVRIKLEEYALEHFELVSREKADILKSQAEINANKKDEFTKKDIQNPGQYLSCDLRLKGTYQITPGQMIVYLEMLRQETMEKMGVYTLTINLSNLNGLTTDPDIPASQKTQIETIASTDSKNNDFELLIWPDKGNGATYYGGEKVYVHVRANRDCYLRLYHIDVDQKIYFLFPKPPSGNCWIQAGRTYTLPFDFYGKDHYWRVSTRPEALFGPEKIKAVAQSEPFTNTPTEPFVGEYNAGTFRNLVTRGSARSLDDVIPGTSAQTALAAEAFCAYKTQKHK